MPDSGSTRDVESDYVNEGCAWPFLTFHDVIFTNNSQ